MATKSEQQTANDIKVDPKALYLEDHSESTMISRGIPLTGLEYFPKPVKLKALMAKVEDMLGRGPDKPKA